MPMYSEMEMSVKGAHGTIKRNDRKWEQFGHVNCFSEPPVSLFKHLVSLVISEVTDTGSPSYVKYLLVLPYFCLD